MARIVAAKVLADEGVTHAHVQFVDLTEANRERLRSLIASLER